ncbi:hypothetical protein, partial [Staphylococcus epidermidis]|uniref:hypothetical protein n=1 Tax=Staphylococcus epidermidis TaxID=1282 RepID=UPI00164322F4
TPQFQRQFKQQKTQAQQLTEQYFTATHHYNNLKQQLHHHQLQLHTLKTQQPHLKNQHQDFQFQKNHGYQTHKTKQTLKQNQNHLTHIQQQFN